MWQQMSRSSRDHDKDIRQLLYRVSSVLRPLDNTLRFLYLSKPEDSAEQATRDTWLQIEQTMLNGRALLLDSLSFGNEIRKEKALKSISPGYRKPSDREEVFGDDLPEIIQKENAANKLFNDALWQKHRSFQQYQPRTQPPSSFQFKKPNKFQQTSNYRGRGKSSNWNFRSQPQQQGNQQFGGQQNRQSSS